MRVTLLHSADALEPPADPVVGQIAASLEEGGHALSRVAATDVVSLVAALRREEPELVFNIAEAFAGRSALESNVAALLNLMDLRYTGAGPTGLLLAGDKTLAKKVMRFHGLKTPEFATVYRGAVDWAGNIEFPVIVKPPQEDASIGITAKSVVSDLKELFDRIDALQTEFQQPVLVEEYVDGREFYVSVLGNLDARALPVMEMDFSGFPAGVPHVATWEAKWGPDGSGRADQVAAAGAPGLQEFAGTKSIFPRDLGDSLVEKMQQAALSAFAALRLRDYARIDLRVTPAEEIFVIEVNPNCYLERTAEFARAAEKSGLQYGALVGRIVELAVSRYSR